MGGSAEQLRPFRLDGVGIKTGCTEDVHLSDVLIRALRPPLPTIRIARSIRSEAPEAAASLGIETRPISSRIVWYSSSPR